MARRSPKTIKIERSPDTLGYLISPSGNYAGIMSGEVVGVFSKRVFAMPNRNGFTLFEYVYRAENSTDQLNIQLGFPTRVEIFGGAKNEREAHKKLRAYLERENTKHL